MNRKPIVTKRGIAFPVVLGVMVVALACNALLPQNDPPGAPGMLTEPAAPGELRNLPQTEDDVPRVGVEEARAALDSGAAVIVDVRSEEAYAAGHVTGALSIPLDEFENDIRGIPLEKDQWILTYCT